MENDPQFLGGADFNAEEKPMPTDDQLNALRHNSQNGGLHFNNPIEINLNADGTATITERLGGPSWRQVIIDKDAHTKNGSQNLEIHASVMALDKSFTAHHFSFYSSILQAKHNSK